MNIYSKPGAQTPPWSVDLASASCWHSKAPSARMLKSCRRIIPNFVGWKTCITIPTPVAKFRCLGESFQSKSQSWNMSWASTSNLNGMFAPKLAKKLATSGKFVSCCTWPPRNGSPQDPKYFKTIFLVGQLQQSEDVVMLYNGCLRSSKPRWIRLKTCPRV